MDAARPPKWMFRKRGESRSRPVMERIGISRGSFSTAIPMQVLWGLPHDQVPSATYTIGGVYLWNSFRVEGISFRNAWGERIIRP